MFSAILILLIMPFTDLGRSRGLQFRPLSKIAFYVFVANFLILMQLGAKHVESPFIEFGQISTVLYFSHFLIIVPLISLLENSLTELHTNIYNKKKPNFFYLFLLDLFFPIKEKLIFLLSFLMIVFFYIIGMYNAMQYSINCTKFNCMFVSIYLYGYLCYIFMLYFYIIYVM
jgi:ubiquinol-cytochrome c reductase cytochrome b subunit